MSTDPLPPIAGRETELLALRRQPRPLASPRSGLQLQAIDSAFACALHMHQPTIPAGRDGRLISHLQFMLEHPHEGDHHNAEPFAHCYRRLAEILPQLINEGCNPRIMLDYSGNLLWGFEQMGRHDILAALRSLTLDPQLQPHVEWLGTFWSHAVASSTPVADLKLQMLAWQQHFAALFGDEALQRVKGFSPPEMHLPNHPDQLHAFVKALRECGYHWLMVQEHSVENPDGSPLSSSQKYTPNRLVARSSSGDSISITVLIKTQGSDTKLVGQMQPCYEAMGIGRQQLGDRSIPAIVTQIADGENGGVMMNEFPAAYIQAHHRLAQDADGACRTVAINGSEYLQLLESADVHASDFPPVQAAQQWRLQQELSQAAAGQSTGPEAVAAAIGRLKARDPSFSMAGSSWTNQLSWEEGYANILEPLAQLSADFHRLFDPLVAADAGITASSPYQQALLPLLLLETSCFRYWGQGTWTGYASEIQRRGQAALASARRHLDQPDPPSDHEPDPGE